MATKPTILTAEPRRVTEATDLGGLLDDAERGIVLLERDGIVFRLSRDDAGIAYEPDPEHVRMVLAETAGSWADLDVDQIIEDIYRGRIEGSRPLDRP